MAITSDLLALLGRSSLEAGPSIGVQAMVFSEGCMVPMPCSQSRPWHPRKESVDTVSKALSLLGGACVIMGALKNSRTVGLIILDFKELDKAMSESV